MGLRLPAVAVLVAVLVVLLEVTASAAAAGATMMLAGDRMAMEMGNGEGRRGMKSRDAYAAMMYMGTPRDYEFYVATRVMLRSIARLKADADLVVIASVDVPMRWQRAM
ncbi:unnamed protein product [Spirodela intermedia]|uniref:Uncharacterized protein n=1 Tax=Spirodela intermedia TaxID=51605 RepID=A0A7I8IH10_SPIIN|nr:unnamed protein product [Spirodela intermedia]CAA6656142.1 unnamed protein product [Spirodela intermedia]